MCPGVDSASKNEYQDTPGGEGGRCVRVTNLPPSCAESREDPAALTSWNPKGHSRLVVENLYLFFLHGREIRSSGEVLLDPQVLVL
jgi:hypothetical protein